jgi:hypothetical protein
LSVINAKWRTFRRSVQDAQSPFSAPTDIERRSPKLSVSCQKVTTPEPDQQTILDYLKVRL